MKKILLFFLIIVANVDGNDIVINKEAILSNEMLAFQHLKVAYSLSHFKVLLSEFRTTSFSTNRLVHSTKDIFDPELSKFARGLSGGVDKVITEIETHIKSLTEINEQLREKTLKSHPQTKQVEDHFGKHLATRISQKIVGNYELQVSKKSVGNINK